MQRSKVFLWSSFLLLLTLVSCEDDEAKIWDVHYEVVRQTGNSGEYRVTYTTEGGASIQTGGITSNVWESPSKRIAENKVVSMKFVRISGTGEYRIRIYVGGAHVSEATVPVGINEEEITYSIPRA